MIGWHEKAPNEKPWCGTTNHVLCEKCKQSFDTLKQLSCHNKMKGDCSSKWC